MAMMTGGQALVKSLYMEGVRVVFGLPGVQTYHAMDALYDEPGIQFVTTRHEQAAAYMAFGYSKVGDDIGTALVVPGPGLQNASAGIGTAYSTSCPIMVVSGQIGREHIGRNRGQLHEINDQLDIVRPVTKWASRVLNAADVPHAVHEAFFHLRSGRPRPVEIEIPHDTLAEVDDIEPYEPAVVERKAPNLDSVSQGANALAASATPLIWAGGGVLSSGASDVLLKVAEHLQAPIVTPRGGKGAISDRHYLAMGVPNFRADAFGPLEQQVQRSDVILAVGTRLAETSFSDKQKVLHIDVDPEEIGRYYPNTVSIVGDARRALEELYQRLSSDSPSRPSRRNELEATKLARFDPSTQVQPQGAFVSAIRAAMPEDGILVEGVTQVGYHCRVFYPVYTPRTYLDSSYFGNLGYAYPSALGAKVARPDKAVVAISGDGGFLYNSQELATAVKYGINAVVIVFNDNAYGNVLRDQKTMFHGRVIGSELHNPDFLRLADAYGVRGVRVKGPEQLESALRAALSIEAPTLIEVPVGVMPSPF